MASERLEQALDIKPIIEEIEIPGVVQDIADDPRANYLTCPGCSENESLVLEALQDRGITDKYALAVILGTIRQESQFDSKICEGGKRTGYHGSYRGGIGLIQFTSAHRYLGLGKFARDHQMDPDCIKTQIQYVFTEREWQLAEVGFKTPGKSVDFYMNYAYKWLGWGVHGKRTHYSHEYLKILK